MQTDYRQSQDDQRSGRASASPAAIQTVAEFGEMLMQLTKGQVRGLSDAADVPRSTLSGWATGQHLPNPNQMAQFNRLLGVLGVGADEQALWTDAVLRVRRAASTRRDDAAAPYLGLTAFDVGDAGKFFGRESLVDQLVALVQSAAVPGERSRLVAVVGASGAGKSSLLRAGLARRVSSGAVSGVGSVVVTTPSLTAADQLTAIVNIGADALEDCTGDPAVAPGVIIVDQLEELLTTNADDASEEYLVAVSGLASSAGGPVVVVGVRADFYQRILAIDGFETALQNRQLIVIGMTTTELRRAVVEPARQVGVTVDDDLVGLIIDDLSAQRSISGRIDPGTLPLLSHALRETWRSARQNTMRIGDYLELGGLRGAVERTAESAYLQLSPADQEVARGLFRRFVSIDRDGLVARRRIDLNDLPNDDASNRVLVHFIGARLLCTEESFVTLTHEVLLGAWQRLREWVSQDRVDMSLHGELREACEVWRSHSFDESTLAAGGRLERLTEWAGSPTGARMISPLESEYLDASSAREARMRRSQRRTQRRLQRLAVAATVFGLAATASTGVAVRSRNQARDERNDALSRRIALQSDQLSPSEPTLASQLALVGFQVAETAESRSALIDRSAAPRPQRFLGAEGSTALAIGPDATVFASTNAADGSIQLFRLQPDGTAARWKVATNPNAEPGVQLYAVAISPDGSLLAAGGANGFVTMWAIGDGDASPAIVAPQIGSFDGGVQAILFDAAGSTLNIAGPGDAVQRFDVRNAKDPQALDPLPAPATSKALAYSPDQRFLAIGSSDGSLRLFDVSREPAELLSTFAPPREGDQLHAVAFHPSGSRLAVGYRSHEIQVLDVDAEGALTEAAGPVSPFTSWVNAMTYSTDGGTLYAGSSDNTIRAWRTDDWTEVHTFTMTSAVTGLGLLADGRIVTASFDGSTRVWASNASPYAGPRSTVFNLFFDENGDRLAVFPGGRDGTVEVWDSSQLPVLTPLNDRIPGLADTAYSGAGTISRDGATVYAGTDSGPVAVIDVRDPTAAAPQADTLDGHTALVETVAVSRDGTLLATGSDDAHVELWDISDPSRTSKLEATMVTTEFAYTADFHPTAPVLAVASSDDTVYVWNYELPASETNPIRLKGFENDAVAVAFSDDGALLAAGSSDRTVRVWDMSDLASPAEVGEPLTGPQGAVFGLDFQPGSRLLGAAAQDGAVWMWDLSDPRLPELFAVLKAARSKLNSLAFSPDGAFVVAAGSAGRLFVWNTGTAEAAAAMCVGVGEGMTTDEWSRLLPEVTPTTVCG